jgi:biopolymer transport protein ExbD
MHRIAHFFIGGPTQSARTTRFKGNHWRKPMRHTIPFLSDPEDAAPLLDINTTPLIDVLLVLLIMLLINLPLGTHAVKLSLGGGVGEPIKRETVTIEIDFDGSLYWNDDVVPDLARLEGYLAAMAAKGDRAELRINANRRARYDVVAKVLAAAQRNGIRNVGFVGNERFLE